MSLQLIYITNCPQIAQIAEQAGVDIIFVDLEIHGKEDRQGHLDTVISRHELEDIRPIKNVLKKSELLVRVNPIYYNSQKEINKVINEGADIVMLPFFKTVEEVQKFISFVDKRAKTCLLLETPEAVEKIDEILAIDGIDLIHIGLNDLHLGYKMDFIFEPLTNGLVEKLSEKIKSKGIKFGFGGIASLGKGMLSAEKIIIEHHRLRSNMVILSRSFCNVKEETNLQNIECILKKGISDIKDFERGLSNKELHFFENNLLDIKQIVGSIVESKRTI